MARYDEARPDAPSGVRIHYEIPAGLHRRAKAEAALRGLTLKDFLIEVLGQAVADQPTAPSRNEPRKKR